VIIRSRVSGGITACVPRAVHWFQAARDGSRHRSSEVYAGLKGGVVAFSKSIARELARFNINVNCTAPGPTDTPLEHDQDPAVVERIIKKIPFRRWASPDEQAAAIAFFASDDARYITGQVLSVSGGLTMS
jgi:2-hydroxycyclohexanecarboxyl-CoA dehydrogenase